MAKDCNNPHKQFFSDEICSYDRHEIARFLVQQLIEFSEPYNFEPLTLSIYNSFGQEVELYSGTWGDLAAITYEPTYLYTKVYPMVYGALDKLLPRVVYEVNFRFVIPGAENKIVTCKGTNAAEILKNLLKEYDAIADDLPPYSIHEKDAKVEIQRLDGNYYHFCWARSYGGKEILHDPRCVIELCEGIVSVLNQMYNKV